MEFTQYCRTCASETKQLRSIYEEIEHGKTIAEAINMCTQVSLHENEMKPKQICLECLKRLESAYQFYNMVKKSEDRFDEWILIHSVRNLVTETVEESNGKYHPLDNHEVFGIELRAPETLPFELERNKTLSSSTEELSHLKTEDIFVEEPNILLSCDESEQSNNYDSFDEMPLKQRQHKQRKPHVRKKITNLPKPNQMKSNAEFECYRCKLAVSSMHKLKVHMKEHDASAKCRVCMGIFTKCEYMQHLCNGSTIDCEYCSKPFNTTASLIKHINRNHKDHKNYKCKKCAKAFHMKVLLELHKPTHNLEEKRFVCDICNSRFRTRYLIKEHIEINHTDKRCKQYSASISYLL